MVKKCKECGKPIKRKFDCWIKRATYCSLNCAGKNSWKNRKSSGISLYRNLGLKPICSCGSKEKIHIHHKDGNRHNNKLKNLEVLCASCHSKIHQKVKNFKNAYKKLKRGKDGRFYALSDRHN